MSIKQKFLRPNKKSSEEIFLDLWQSSVFDDECFEVLEKLVKKLDKKVNKNRSLQSELHSKEVFDALVTVRNKKLIARNEQQALKKTVVAFFGLSVGSHAAITWIIESRADNIKIIDPDTITPTNLNRLRYGVSSIGKYKTDVLEDVLMEIHPFISVIKNISKNSYQMEKVLNQQPKADVIVDEIDDIGGKIALRLYAKANKIPVITAADVGDNVTVDIERYDLSPQPKLFLGKIPKIESINLHALSDLERKKLIIKYIGFEKNSEKLLDSLASIGKELATWPQLGATASIAGGVIASILKKIVLRENVKSGRYYVSLDDIFVKDFKNKKNIKVRSELIQKVKKKFNL